MSLFGKLRMGMSSMPHSVRYGGMEMYIPNRKSGQRNDLQPETQPKTKIKDPLIIQIFKAAVVIGLLLVYLFS